MLRVTDIEDLGGKRILDAGCGEGKNAAFAASLGASVDAVDVSELALEHGKRILGATVGINWHLGDIRECLFFRGAYDVVIAYGLLHCLPSEHALRDTVKRLRALTRNDGLHVICAFNSRMQELHAHPGFEPTLLSHDALTGLYGADDILFQSDTNLTEAHPHNRITHTHSLTRIIARVKHG